MFNAWTLVCFAHCIVVCFSEQNVAFGSASIRCTVWRPPLLSARAGDASGSQTGWPQVNPSCSTTSLHHSPLEKICSLSPRPATLTLFHLLSYPIDSVLQISVTKLHSIAKDKQCIKMKCNIVVTTVCSTELVISINVKILTWHGRHF